MVSLLPDKRDFFSKSCDPVEWRSPSIIQINKFGFQCINIKKILFQRQWRKGFINRRFKWDAIKGGLYTNAIWQ